MAAAATAASGVFSGPVMMFGSIAYALGLPTGVVWGSFALAAGVSAVMIPGMFITTVNTVSFMFTLVVILGALSLPLILGLAFWNFGGCMGWWSFHKHHGDHHGASHHEHSDHHHGDSHHHATVHPPRPPMVPMFGNKGKVTPTGDGGNRRKKGKGRRK